MNHLELTIEGMTCGSCVSRVTRALEAIPGVEHADVDLKTGRASVTGKLPFPEVLRSTVRAAGYEAAVFDASVERARNAQAQAAPNIDATGSGCGSGRAGKAGGGCCCH